MESGKSEAMVHIDVPKLKIDNPIFDDAITGGSGVH
jgi:hypothetical protein